jgi:hypothetical protein
MRTGTDSPSSSNALVTLKPETTDDWDSRPHRPLHRVSTFITQLIATARHVPQTREKRRADPEQVIAAYRATVERLQKLNEKSE